MKQLRCFCLLFLSLVVSAQVKVTQFPDRVTVEIDRQPASSFFFGPAVTKPYVYPIRSAQGIIVSRQWPMDNLPGERHDHIHHRGIWFAHSSVNGIDFWNSDPSYHNANMGHIVVSKITKVSSGRKRGEIAAELEWQDPVDRGLVREHRTMIFHKGDPRMIDFDIILTAAQNVTFGDDKDGVFGMRLAAGLEESPKNAPSAPARTGVITSSTGCVHEEGCWGKRAEWTDVSGQVQGTVVGVTVLDHPDNPRHPTYWHVRGYGLLAANIFGAKAFTKGSEKDVSLGLTRGDSLRFRYRVIVHNGNAQTAGIERLSRAYAHQTR